jgi:sugar lactone lactonase YvrE
LRRLIRRHPCETVGETIDRLGEGPHWVEESNELVRVDLYDGLVHRLSLETLQQSTIAVGGAVGFAIPRVEGGLVAGIGHEIVLIEPDGARRTLTQLQHELNSSRINDGKCDARGRLWTGTLSRIRQLGAGGLYRIDPDGQTHRMVAGVTMGNGLGWNPAADRMYFVDSTTRQVDVFDFDLDAGTISNRRTLVRIDPRLGMPDGLAVDSSGGVWVALFRGGAVHRYTPDGELDAVVDVPVSTPTSVAFGGLGLGDLFITTARHRLGPAALAREPLAGRLFRAKPDAPGAPNARFAG